MEAIEIQEIPSRSPVAAPANIQSASKPPEPKKQKKNLKKKKNPNLQKT